MNHLFVTLLLILVSVSYADIYKWSDDSGAIHFSDTPHLGAEKMNIPSPPCDSSSGSRPIAPVIKRSNSNVRAHFYTEIAIVQPENKATIRNNQGFIAVTVKVEPNLYPGDKLSLIFDGSPLGMLQTNLHFRLKGIYRGSHTLAIQIVDSHGIVVKTSNPITIYVFRPRIGMRARH